MLMDANTVFCFGTTSLVSKGWKLAEPKLLHQQPAVGSTVSRVRLAGPPWRWFLLPGILEHDGGDGHTHGCSVLCTQGHRDGRRECAWPGALREAQERLQSST